MTSERDVPTPEEDVYALYEALTDARDEAELLAQEAEGQPIGDEWEARRRELETLRRTLGLPSTRVQERGRMAEQEAER